LVTTTTIENDILCFGASTGRADVFADGGNPPYSYAWNNGSSTSNSSNLIIGTYTVTVTDENGCTATNSVTISQPASALSATGFTEDVSCFGGDDGAIGLNITGGIPPYSTSLNGIQYGGAFLIPGLEANNYTAYVLDDNDCFAFVSNLVVGEPAPFSVDLGLDTTIWLGQSVQLLPTILGNQGPTSYVWDQDSPDTSLVCLGAGCSSALVTPPIQTTYYVSVTDAAGCVAEDDILVILEFGALIMVPTGFNPNGDPLNQSLHVHGNTGARIVSFQVYDRWGNQIFAQNDFGVNDFNIGWNGTYKGQPLDPGVYTWMVEAEFANGVKQVFNGETNLLR
jgi:gliding motility-associated-like protein